MKVVVAQEALLKMLLKVSSVVTGKATSAEIYNCILLETLTESLRMTGTDGDVTAMGEVSAQIDAPGTLAIPSKKLLEIVRKLPNKEIILDGNETGVTILCARVNYKLTSFNPDIYPERPILPGSYDYEIPAGLIAHLVDKVSFAVAVEDPRPAFNGIYWKTKENGFDLVATDTHKLARIFLKTDPGQSPPADKIIEAIIPPKALRLLSKLDTDQDTQLSIKLLSNHLLMRVNNFVIYSTLLRGPYPDYERVIPYTNDIIVEVDRQEFLDAVERVAIVSNAITHMVKFSFSSGVVLLNGINIDSGDEGSEEVPVVYSGDPIQIGFNGEYIQSILKLLDSERIIIKLKGVGSAGMIVPVNQEEKEDLLYVIMPLKFTDI
ncbi:MAG: DNA polymerase III subunit beta [Candidatus Delongbacteria bacterium]|nr:DNA polymerase III subunit beta [Candidatus Delongbacteria bacterium]